MREAESRDRQDNRELHIPDRESPRPEDRQTPLSNWEGYSADVLEALES